MARDVILATWAVCAGVVGTYSWNDSDHASDPLWVRLGGAALVGVAGGGMLAVVVFFAIALIVVAVGALL